MWIYNLLDVALTITEAAIFYVIILFFCKTCRFKKAISRVIPPVIYAAVVFRITFFTEIGASRIFILSASMVVLVLLCYKVSFHCALIIMELAYLLMIPLSESVGFLIMYWLFQGGITTQVDGNFVIKWQAYIIILLIRWMSIAVIYQLLKNFQYEIQPKDAAILSISFLLVLCVSFANTYSYLNLGMYDTFVLDLSTSVCGAFFVVQFLYSRNVSYLREQEQRGKWQIAQLQQQYAYYQDKLKAEERIRSIYHDMKNHLLVLENGQSTEATKQMAQELRLQIADYENYIHTGNSFLDIIIRDKSEKTREKDIDFSVSIDFDGIDFLEPLDISTLFGNGIDNAIEASEKLSEEQRVIVVKAAKVQNFLPILIENNCADNPRSDSRTTKTDKFLHGFGISNMRKTAEKYGGQLTTKYENGRFTLKILIPVP